MVVNSSAWAVFGAEGAEMAFLGHLAAGMGAEAKIGSRKSEFPAPIKSGGV